MSFMLATTTVEGVPTPVLVVDGAHHRLDDLAPELVGAGGGEKGGLGNPHGLMTLLHRWKDAEPELHELAASIRDGSRHATVAAPEREEGWLTPLQYPAKVICTGANYLDHVTKDGGHSGYSKEDSIPVFFLKPPTTTLVGLGRSVRYPAQTQKFDYEVELACIIGTGGRNIPPETALQHVAGYSIALDLSARDWQRHPKHLVKFDLFGAKAFDDSCPLGPGIVPARGVDPTDLDLRLWVNGDLRQDANTSDMIWPVTELIALASEHVTLEPGDVILTGTPSGVGLATGTWLEAGDVIRAEISGGLGSMSVTITPARRTAGEGGE